MKFIKKSTAYTIQVGPFLDKADGVTPITTLNASSMDAINAFKEGSSTALDLKSETTLTHIAGGIYSMTLSTTDTDTLGSLFIHLRKDATCLPVWRETAVIAANIYDSFFGTSNLSVDVAKWATVAVTAGVNNLPAVDAVAIGGSTTAADNVRRGAEALVQFTVADLTASSSSFITTLTEATTDHYKGRTVTFTTGVLAGQSATITGYNGSTKTITVGTMTDAPSNGDKGVIA